MRFNYVEWGHWHDGYNVGIKDNLTGELYDFGDKELNSKLGTVDNVKIELISSLVSLLNSLSGGGEFSNRYKCNSKLQVDDEFGYVRREAYDNLRYRILGYRERFIVDDAGTLIDMETRNTYDYMEDVKDLLNEVINKYEGFSNEE